MPVSAVKSEIAPCALCKNNEFKTALICEDFYFVRCIKCGLVQRNPQPDKNEIIARYSTQFGKDYLSYELANENAFLNLQLLALKDAKFEFDAKQYKKPTVKNLSVLDIGCATGALLEYLRTQGWHVTGVEISPSGEYARNERGLDVRSSVLEETGFSDNSFDCVLASHLIEHLNDPRLFLTEVHRILKKDGQFFITTPDISGFQARLYGSKWRSAIFDHLYLFSTRTLIKMLKDTGFKVTRRRTWGGLAAGMAPKWLKKIMDRAVKIFGCGDVMILKAQKI